MGTCLDFALIEGCLFLSELLSRDPSLASSLFRSPSFTDHICSYFVGIKRPEVLLSLYQLFLNSLRALKPDQDILLSQPALRANLSCDLSSLEALRHPDLTAAVIRVLREAIASRSFSLCEKYDLLTSLKFIFVKSPPFCFDEALDCLATIVEQEGPAILPEYGASLEILEAVVQANRLSVAKPFVRIVEAVIVPGHAWLMEECFEGCQLRVLGVCLFFCRLDSINLRKKILSLFLRAFTLLTLPQI